MDLSLLGKIKGVEELTENVDAIRAGVTESVIKTVTDSGAHVLCCGLCA